MRNMWRDTESLPLGSEPRTAVALTSWVIFGLAMLSASALAATHAVLDRVNLLVPDITPNMDISKMPAVDVDGDGLPEAVMLGSVGESDVIRVFGIHSGKGWVAKQALIPERGENYFDDPKITAWVDADGPHILYMRGSQINRYSGWPLTPDESFQIALPRAEDIAVADVDSDGSLELVVIASGEDPTIRALSLKTGALLWEIRATAYDFPPRLHIAQLDSDPAMEIVLGGGAIFDGATHATEWEYNIGFGPHVHAGRFGGLTPRFAGITSRLVMFQSGPWSPLWDMEFTNMPPISSAVADIDGDDYDEVVFSHGVIFVDITVVDAIKQVVRSVFPSIGAYQLAIADFDGDSQLEVAMSSIGAFASLNEGFGVIDATTGLVEYEDPLIAPGGYTAGTFVEEAGELDVIFGSTSQRGYRGTLTRVDALTGEVRWHSVEGDPMGLSAVSALQIVNMAGQQNPTILAQGHDTDTGSIAAYNSGSGSAMWSIDAGDFPDYPHFKGLAAIDLDSDSLVDAILTCTNRKLRLFDVANQSLLWTSIAMPDTCVDVMQMSTSRSKQLVAVTHWELQAFDAQTHLPTWSLPIPLSEQQSEGATYLNQGVEGPEIAVFSRWAVNFFDAELRTPLRRYELGSYDIPIQAIAQPPGGSIHDLAITIGDRLHILDGATGNLLATSEALGYNAGKDNQLAVHTNADGSYLVSLGSDVAVLTYRASAAADRIFGNGFEN